MIPYPWFEEAAARLSTHIIETPLDYDPRLDLYLKWENRQLTGSFKARGALNKVLAMQPWERERGLVAASAGNHGQALALAGNLVKAPVIIFVSEKAVPIKIEYRNATVLMMPEAEGDRHHSFGIPGNQVHAGA